MNIDCIHNFREPWIFPKRPDNRPGLDHIAYRIGTYADFRDALMQKLNQDPVLKEWTHREPDDPGIALLEGASILGDILAFYQELYANEAYLRTAKWQESIAELVRLLGYRLSPGLGGKATFAFEVKGDKPVVIPADFPIKAQVEGSEKPVDFETTKEKIAYPWLSKFNLYRPLYEPNITQNTKEFYIYSPDQYLNPVELEKGDRLMIGDPYPQDTPEDIPDRLINGEIVIVDEIRKLHGCKLYKIKGSLKKRISSTDKIVGFKLGRSFRHFGHNSPPKVVSVSDNIANQTDVSYERLLNNAFPLDVKVDDLALGVYIICETILRGRVDYIDYFTPVTFALIRTIQEIRQISYTLGAVTGESTMVILDSGLTTTTDPAVDTFIPNVQRAPLGIDQPIVSREVLAKFYTYDKIDIREIQFHEVLSPLLRLRAGKQETSIAKGKELYFYGTDAEARSMKERQLLFEKTEKDSFTANVTSVRTLSQALSTRPLLCRITLDRDVDYTDFPNVNPIVTVYGNLVEATQGKTEKKVILGNGDNRQTFQTFKLPKSPLTYLLNVGATPPEVPEIKIYVNDRMWKYVPSLYGHGPKEEIYIIREDDDGVSWVQFGDGKTGMRLPSGINNVVAIYRTGTGAYGRQKEETKIQAGKRLDRLEDIRMQGNVFMGSLPESGEKARLAAPGKIQSLGRMVSLKDYESEALAIPGVLKAEAVWGLLEGSNTPGIIITVLMENSYSGSEKEFERLMNDYNRHRGPARFPIRIKPGSFEYIHIGMIVKVDPTYLKEKVIAAIKETLGVCGEEGNGIDASKGLMSWQKRRFGQHEYATRITGTVQNMAGVKYAGLLSFYSLGSAEDPADIRIRIPLGYINLVSQQVVCEDDHIHALYKDHLTISISEGDS